jgi:diacylglycerol kinase family enzyme
MSRNGVKKIVVPRAKPDDGYLHFLAVRSGQFRPYLGAASSFAGWNEMGKCSKARHIQISTSREEYLQTDGTVYKMGDRFDFKVLAGHLRMVY